MTDQELAAKIHQDLSENPRMCKNDARKKYGAPYSRLTRMESEGLIPKFRVMPPAERAKRAKSQGKGWMSGLGGLKL